MDFIETTALRQRRNGGREVTVTSRLHRQKDKERQRKTAEKGDRRPVVAPGAGVRWRGSSTGAPGAGLRITVAKDLRGQGSRLSTGQAEGGPHAPEEAVPPPAVGFVKADMMFITIERRWVLLKRPRGDIDELGEEQ